MRDWCAQISVCGLELWPEARKCEDDWRLGQGVLGGTVLMGWTLYIGI
jgi:ZIP family zinc transporter